MPDQSKPERRSWLIPAAAVLVGIIAIVFVLVQAAGRDDGSSDDRADAATVKPQQSEWEYRDPDDPMAVGPVDAPLGTAARPTAPESRSTSTSTVGLPRESRISRPTTSSMVLMVSAGLRSGSRGTVGPTG